MRDLSLTAEGLLQGQVSNAKKAASSRVMVSIRQNRKEVHRARTDDKGRFEVSGLKPGIYYIVAGTGHGLYRVWASKMAPPKALKTARIISDTTLTRSQDPQGANILYDENGVAYGQVLIVDNGGLVPVSPGGAFAPSGSFLGSLGLYDLLIIGGVGTAIGLGAAALNDDDDNPPPPPPTTP